MGVEGSQILFYKKKKHWLLFESLGLMFFIKFFFGNDKVFKSMHIFFLQLSLLKF